MSIQRQSQTSQHSALCPQCLLFYGSQAYQQLCSTCYKKKALQKKIQINNEKSQKKIEVSVLEEKKQENKGQQLQKDKKRCYTCSKKVGYLGTQCKCCFVFCNSHRLPESHNCNYNFRQKGQKDLEKTVVKIDNGKIQKL